MKEDLIETYVRLVVEARQAHLTGDRSADWGSQDHIDDLEGRCADAAYWRDKCPKGSERRSHYRSIYNQLKRELQSAKKKNQLNEKQKKSNRE